MLDFSGLKPATLRVQANGLHQHSRLLDQSVLQSSSSSYKASAHDQPAIAAKIVTLIIGSWQGSILRTSSSYWIPSHKYVFDTE